MPQRETDAAGQMSSETPEQLTAFFQGASQGAANSNWAGRSRLRSRLRFVLRSRRAQVEGESCKLFVQARAQRDEAAGARSFRPSAVGQLPPAPR